MSARQREPAGDGDTSVRFFLGAIAPPQAAEGAQFCKLPPETRACRKAAARGVQGKNQRRLRCESQAHKTGRRHCRGDDWALEAEAESPCERTVHSKRGLSLHTNKRPAGLPAGRLLLFRMDDANRPAFTPARWSAGSAAGPPVRAWRSAHW